MERSTITTSSVAGSRGLQTDAATDERYVPHFRSLTMPGLAKGPILPEWLRKLFRRTETPAAR
jgi:hypothetical protein